MESLPRSLDAVFAEHLASLRQMVFVTGPRQVGKTTSCRGVDEDATYLDWDDQDHRDVILRGPHAVAELAGAFELSENRRTLVLDELHKYPRWQTFLKGLFDTHGHRLRIVVTGSSRLDVFRRGGDSLMGRYQLYRMHPLTVGELLHGGTPREGLRPPAKLAPEAWNALLEFGGFPEPYIRGDARFARRWQRLRTQQFVAGDVRDLTRVQALGQLESLVRILSTRSGAQLNYSNLATDVRVSVDTMRRWIDSLCSLHHGFLIRPWFANLSRALRKEPKWFLRDWSTIRDPGTRCETFIACHLLKAVETWTDMGFGDYELRYIRDKERREVDFVVVRDGTPWFLVEAKRGKTALSPALEYFRTQTSAGHAFQVTLDMPYVAADCGERATPCIVPAQTFLSQLP